MTGCRLKTGAFSPRSRLLRTQGKQVEAEKLLYLASSQHRSPLGGTTLPPCRVQAHWLQTPNPLSLVPQRRPTVAGLTTYLGTWAGAGATPQQGLRQ